MGASAGRNDLDALAFCTLRSLAVRRTGILLTVGSAVEVLLLYGEVTLNLVRLSRVTSLWSALHILVTTAEIPSLSLAGGLFSVSRHDPQSVALAGKQSSPTGEKKQLK